MQTPERIYEHAWRGDGWCRDVKASILDCKRELRIPDRICFAAGNLDVLEVHVQGTRLRLTSEGWANKGPFHQGAGFEPSDVRGDYLR